MSWIDDAKKARRFHASGSLLGLAVNARVSHYDGDDIAVESADCMAIHCLPWVYPDGLVIRRYGLGLPHRSSRDAVQDFGSRWREANSEERQKYVERRRDCPCKACRKWRQENHRKRNKKRRRRQTKGGE